MGNYRNHLMERCIEFVPPEPLNRKAMEFLMQYHLLGLVIGIATISDHRPVSSGCSESRILLGHRMLVDFPVIGHRWYRLVALHRQRAGRCAGWRIRFFSLWTIKELFEQKEARAQRLVSPQSETSGEIAAIQQDLVNCTGANFRGERAPS